MISSHALGCSTSSMAASQWACPSVKVLSYRSRCVAIRAVTRDGVLHTAEPCQVTVTLITADANAVHTHGAGAACEIAGREMERRVKQQNWLAVLGIGIGALLSMAVKLPTFVISTTFNTLGSAMGRAVALADRATGEQVESAVKLAGKGLAAIPEGAVKVGAVVVKTATAAPVGAWQYAKSKMRKKKVGVPTRPGAAGKKTMPQQKRGGGDGKKKGGAGGGGVVI